VYLAVIAVALCVFMAFVVITVLAGMTAEFKQKTHNFVGDCVVSSKSLVGFGYYEQFLKTLEEQDFIKAASPVIKNHAFLTLYTKTTNIRSDLAVEILGIEPARHSSVTGFADWLYYHKADAASAFKPSYDANLPGCVAGIDLMLRRDHRGRYSPGREPSRVMFDISCFPLTAKGALAKAGAGLVNTKTFYFSDYSHSGWAKVDYNVVYLPFNTAQLLCGMATGHKRVNAIHISFKPGVSLSAGCEKVKILWKKFLRTKSTAKYANLLKNVRVQSWKIYNRHIIAAVETERTLMSIIFAMLGIITIFIVFVVFYMIICHKSKDIGILKSLGVSSGNVAALFLGFAILLGVLGSVIGAVGAWRFLVNINQIEAWMYEHFQFQLWDRRLYAIGDIPNAIDVSVLATIIVSALVVSVAGAILPSIQAAKRTVVETLQVNQM